MTKLILPAHAKGRTESEQEAMEARNTLVLGFTFVLPGSNQVMEYRLNQPVTVEAVAISVVIAAIEQIKKRKANELAEKLVPSNGHVN